MLSSLLTACAIVFAPLPMFMAAADLDIPTGWLQFGFGGATLFVLYRLLRPLVASQIKATARLAESMDGMARGNAAALEVQRNLLMWARASTRAEERTAATLRALTAAVQRLGGTASSSGR